MLWLHTNRVFLYCQPQVSYRRSRREVTVLDETCLRQGGYLSPSHSTRVSYHKFFAVIIASSIPMYMLLLIAGAALIKYMDEDGSKDGAYTFFQNEHCSSRLLWDPRLQTTDNKEKKSRAAAPASNYFLKWCSLDLRDVRASQYVSWFISVRTWSRNGNHRLGVIPSVRSTRYDIHNHPPFVHILSFLSRKPISKEVS